MSLVSRLWTSAGDVLRHTSLHRDALFLASAAIVSGLGSLVYWKLITLRFPVEMVGLASAGIASATFLSGLSSMGLTTGLVRFVPTQDAVQKSGLIRAAVQISFSTGVVIGLVFLVGRYWWAPLLFPPQAGLVYVIIFFVLLLTTLQVNINTSVIQAERHTPYLLAQSIIVNVIQIAGGGLVAVSLGVTGILFTYMLPVLSVALGFYFALPYLARFAGTIPAVNRPLLGDLLRYSLSAQVFNIIWSLPAIVFPLLTLAWLGAQANAMLALSWYAYTFLAIIPNSMIVALFVDGANQPGQLSRRLWDTLLINLAILMPLVISIVVSAPWLLGFFGSSYVRATLLLRLLAISILPLSINGLYMTLWRVRKQTLQLNIFALFLIVGTITLAGLFTLVFGLDGIGWGWLAGQTLFALASLTLIVRARWVTQPEIG